MNLLKHVALSLLSAYTNIVRMPSSFIHKLKDNVCVHRNVYKEKQVVYGIEYFWFSKKDEIIIEETQIFLFLLLFSFLFIIFPPLKTWKPT